MPSAAVPEPLSTILNPYPLRRYKPISPLGNPAQYSRVLRMTEGVEIESKKGKNSHKKCTFFL